MFLILFFWVPISRLHDSQSSEYTEKDTRLEMKYEIRESDATKEQNVVRK